jgi:anaerobic selenocysteine-containing dehydrogenase
MAELRDSNYGRGTQGRDADGGDTGGGPAGERRDGQGTAAPDTEARDAGGQGGGDSVSYRTCPLCEATCGLAIETSNGDVVKIRGDADDVFSRGFICPNAYGIKQLHEDADRLTMPLVATGS